MKQDLKNDLPSIFSNPTLKFTFYEVMLLAETGSNFFS